VSYPRLLAKSDQLYFHRSPLSGRHPDLWLRCLASACSMLKPGSEWQVEDGWNDGCCASLPKRRVNIAKKSLKAQGRGTRHSGASDSAILHPPSITANAPSIWSDRRMGCRHRASSPLPALADLKALRERQVCRGGDRGRMMPTRASTRRGDQGARNATTTWAIRPRFRKVGDGSQPRTTSGPPGQMKLVDTELWKLLPTTDGGPDEMEIDS
jgi:hypothetical protein